MEILNRCEGAIYPLLVVKTYSRNAAAWWRGRIPQELLVALSHASSATASWGALGGRFKTRVGECEIGSGTVSAYTINDAIEGRTLQG